MTSSSEAMKGEIDKLKKWFSDKETELKAALQKKCDCEVMLESIKKRKHTAQKKVYSLQEQEGKLRNEKLDFEKEITEAEQTIEFSSGLDGVSSKTYSC
mmetsp:Transcript_9264/g.11699  ORF Transcript_9264/g.11699 Transcript_9264/m.11699 type:complete len:99 (+) Transcript_9264:245-541(+)